MNPYIVGAIITILSLLAIVEVGVLAISTWFIFFTTPKELEGLE